MFTTDNKVVNRMVDGLLEFAIVNQEMLKKLDRISRESTSIINECKENEIKENPHCENVIKSLSINVKLLNKIVLSYGNLYHKINCIIKQKIHLYHGYLVSCLVIYYLWLKLIQVLF